MNLKTKKLLVLGSTTASLDIVKMANKMGVHTIVTDIADYGIAMDYAKENIKISTTDYPALVDYIEKNNVDGVFCGPSEFNIQNMINICSIAGLPCYSTKELWDKCAQKDIFKDYCLKYGIDVPEKFELDDNTSADVLENLDYPVIIKPVDGCSSKGISVCMDSKSVFKAYEYALSYSTCKRVICEKYIDNGGEIFSVRYLIKDGEAYPYLIMDTYVVDPITRKSLISGLSHAPSKYLEYYMNNVDYKTRKMLKGMGIKNGTAFIQALPYKGKIYFHEMGFRLSGGMMFKITEPLVHINDMNAMIKFSLGEEIISNEELSKIDLNCSGKIGAQLTVPLNEGIISKVEGLKDVLEQKCIVDCIQYYHQGDIIKKEYIGTLQQHFCRFTLIVESREQLIDFIEFVQNNLKIIDSFGNKMNNFIFNKERLN